MRTFDYSSIPQVVLSPDICNTISAIHEYKGKQELYLSAKPDVLTALLDIAKIQSTDASNRIEGVFTSDVRLKAIVESKSEPRNRNEQEIAGYRDVLTLIHEQYADIPLTPNTLLQMHRDLYGHLASGFGGHWKRTDNVISETDVAGNSVIRFKPLSCLETPMAMDALCRAYTTAVQADVYDPLLLIPIFILDFLSIHPFDDGNGRMSRVLTLLLLYKHGYVVGKFISLEMVVEKSKTTYYEALQSSSQRWHENNNDVVPFLRYTLGTILKTYRIFESRISDVVTTQPSKSERIRLLFDRQIAPLTKKQILSACPDISETTVERTLKVLQDGGYILKMGSRRDASYLRK